MNILLLGFPVLKSAFVECGHDVLTCTTDQTGDVWISEFPVAIDQVLSALPQGWQPDLILLMDESTEPMFLGLEVLDIPLAWYTIDSHLHLHWHRSYAAVFDFVFVAQKDYVPSYEWDRVRQVVKWMPLFCNPSRDRFAPLPKMYDLSFVGMVNDRWKPERSQLLQALSARIPIFISSGDYVTVFNRSKVVLNQCAANDVNFRIFETLACGSLLLTEKVGNGFEELFQDRTHLVVYEKGHIDQIVELAHYYAAHEQERETIAQTGRETVLHAHTSVHRAKSILDVFQVADLHGVIKKRKSMLHEIRTGLFSVYTHAAGVYELACQRYAPATPVGQYCLRAKEAFVRLSSQIRQRDEVGVR